MIESDIPTFLNAIPAVSALVKVYPVQAPATVKLPYAVVESVGGPREKSGSNKMEVHSMFRISVDCGPGQYVTGRQAIEEILKALDNYRGGLGSAVDVFVTCGEIRSWPGIAYVYRYGFDGKMRSIQTRYNG